MNDPEADCADRQKAIRFVEFLTKMAELRAIPMRDIKEYQKAIWFHEIPKRNVCFARAWGRRLDGDTDTWAEVQPALEPQPPGAPSLCEDWVDSSSLRDKSTVPQIQSPGATSHVSIDRPENPGELPFDSEPETPELTDTIQQAWRRYIDTRWLPWRERHDAWEEVQKLYSALFAIHQEQLKDDENHELVMGLGLLVWQSPTGQLIRRHLLVADALLEFEAPRKKFTIHPHSEGAKLRIELDMIDVEEKPAITDDIKAKLAEAADDPWNTTSVQEVLKSLVNSISPQAEYRDDLDPTDVRASEKPIVIFAPALILRKRSTRGRVQALNRIKERIENGDTIPDEFRDISGIGRRQRHDSGGRQGHRQGGFDGEIFFPKPSNGEQRRIVEKMRSANGVLVQGPPGTGKSHTIANLISHLLATGQRMLVTAKTPRALQVLEGLLPEELRPLCINLLGDGQKERKSLASSVSGILRKHEEWDETHAKYELGRLSAELHRLREKKVAIERQLREMRESETYPHSVAEGTYSGTAAVIARKVNDDRTSYDWFTDAVPINDSCPCSASDLIKARIELQKFQPEARRELNRDLAAPELLVAPDAFSKLVTAEQRALADEEDAVRSFLLRMTGAVSRRRRRRRQAEDEISQVETSLRTAAAQRNAHPVVHETLAAVQKRRPEDYALAVRRVEGLIQQKDRLKQLAALVKKLRRSLPVLMEELEKSLDDPAWDQRLSQIRNAWHWAQARSWVEDYVGRDDGTILGKRVKQVEDDIHATIVKLASLNAWSRCFARLNEDHRRHMEAWRQAMGRFGKGTGRHASRYRRQAQEHLSQCREAVPAWVMPLHRNWETVDPAPGMFDVIIIDEASQCGIESLPLFYLGKKILIVGDDKQISPEGAFENPDRVERLKDEYLGKEFPFRSEYNLNTSLFDHGKRQHGTGIPLREHFRCMPEIIRFSNELCYSEMPLIPLRQHGPDRLNPVEHVFVEGGYRKGKGSGVINPTEAEAIVESIAEMCRDRRYDGKSLGVIVLQGEAQGELIERKLLEHEDVGAEEMERRRLICGNPYSFQGDERDVILLSLVAASNERIGTLSKSADERRFNVAASRARDQMILFYSVTCNDLSPKCLRRRLLEFFENPESPQIAGIDRDELERMALRSDRGREKPPAPFDSWFEVDVALELLRKGFNTIPQYEEVAGKRIDLVVENSQARLAIECDGDQYHGADQYEHDMQRQRQLERCGWEFFRIRESSFHANKEEALIRLWDVLEERDIYPMPVRMMNEPEPATEARNAADDDYPNGGDGSEEVDPVTPDNDSRSTENGPAEYIERKQVEDVSASDIQNAILKVLEQCPNHSSTLHSMPKLVLKEFGIRTRGKPRAKFDRRVKRSLRMLERQERVEQYKAKNQRIRLKPGTHPGRGRQ